MNARQRIVLLLMALSIGLIFYFGPKYKMVKLDAYGKDYIKTKSGSSLYKRCNASVRFEWPVITKMLTPVVIIGPLLILLLKDKKRESI